MYHVWYHILGCLCNCSKRENRCRNGNDGCRSENIGEKMKENVRMLKK